MRRLADMKIATRLTLLGTLTAVAVGALTAISTMQLRTVFYAEHENAMKELVDSAVGVAQHYHDLQVAGTLTETEAKAEAATTIQAMRYEDGQGYFWINDLTPVMVMHPTKPELNGTDLSGMKDPDGNAIFLLFVDVVKKDGAGVVRYMWPKPGEEDPQPKISYVAGFDPWGWVIGSGVYVDHVQAELTGIIVRNVAVALLLLALMLALSRLVSRSIIVPLKNATDVLRQGNLRTRLDARAGRTELDHLATALNSMMDNVAVVVDDVASATRGLQQSADGLSTTSSTIQDTARRSEALTEESTRSSREVSSSIDTLASGFQELEGSIDLIGHNAREAAEVAARAVDAARTTTQAVTDLGSSSAEIGVVIATITSIAEQTNLLALNATIEAARAGEAGRGFAVVANEVKDLARETAAATDDIARRVQAIQTATQESASAISEIAEIITRINDHQSGIAHAVAEQTATSSQMSQAVSAAARASAAVADTLDGVLTSAKETTQGVHEVGSTATSLAEVVARLSHAADAFQR